MKLHTTVILVTVWLGVFALHKAEGSVASKSMRKFSCVNLSAQKVDIRSIISYEKHKVPVEAVMFTTTNGIKICVHPDQKWVRLAMKKIDQRRTNRRTQSYPGQAPEANKMEESSLPHTTGKKALVSTCSPYWQ